MSTEKKGVFEQEIKKQNTTPQFAFGKKNYAIMLVGLAILAIGFIVMTMDNEQYGFGFMGITLGPILLLVGFVVQFFAIMIKNDK